ncbi:MAG: methylenetetrahydromethanopterin dehydrogenase [Acetobacteraceae bacterium]|nr:methylenetetrahydromethanopterin dehydrogenase [Acetobacteraceae bacterium]
MADKHILHMLSPLGHVSPFDANMALDAGFDAVLPYTGVTQKDVAGLVQDAIFSRPPKDEVKTGVFIGGKDALAALDMLDAAKEAMVLPFIISLLADPSGSFTTAAAMVARTEKLLRTEHQRGLEGLKVVVFGATGVVGFASGVIAALHGAKVVLAGYDGPERVGRAAAEIGRRFGVTVDSGDASSDELKAGLLREAEAAFCAGRAGVPILSAGLLREAPRLLVVADVNAVPPAGVEGLDAMADKAALRGTGALGIGALAIGQIKYRTEFGLFRRMVEATKPVRFDFRDAFALARELLA